MRGTWVVVAVLAAGCGKSRCEQYAEIEIRCGGHPEPMRKTAEDLCAAVDVSGHIGRSEVDCAVKFLGKDGADCGGYNACIAAIPRR